MPKTRIHDDYHAKIRLWAENPKILPAPPPHAWPKFPPQRFASYQEMQEFKNRLIQLSAQGIQVWTPSSKN
ncbi:MAG: hypothetical protein HC904_07705 [Blastochloris sp.]|nr:hypothetical protein [Blastochloris sp.]